MLKTGEWSADAYIGKYENRLCSEGFYEVAHGLQLLPLH